jgi:phosphatidate cytidylyltransferase
MLAGIAAPFYVGALVAAVALLRRDLGQAGPAFVFLTLTIAWMGDTGGYTFGRLFGKHKLYEAVSPKKTREGFLGSVVFSVGATLVASFTYLPQLPWSHALVLGVLGGALGQLGDLAESLLKRSTGVKDSGALLPGHGGILDRIDALIVVAPLVYVYARLVTA